MPEVLTVHPYWIAIPAALLPGILGWWWSRALPTDAVVLPEWQMGLVKKLSFSTVMCTMAIVAISGWNALWLLPLEFIGLSYSTHRVRRLMLGETWPLHRYLVWRVQGLVGIFGFWMFVAMAPVIVTSARTSRALVGRSSLHRRRRRVASPELACAAVGTAGHAAPTARPRRAISAGVRRRIDSATDAMARGRPRRCAGKRARAALARPGARAFLRHIARAAHSRRDRGHPRARGRSP